MDEDTTTINWTVAEKDAVLIEQEGQTKRIDLLEENIAKITKILDKITKLIIE